MRNLLAFPDESRIWIYQADRPFDQKDVNAINEEIDAFCTQWTSHNLALKAIGGVMHDLFVVLVVDESQSSASGCSIDKSVAFVKYLEQKYGRMLLLRDHVAWMDAKEAIHLTPLSELKHKLTEGVMDMNTLVFDNLVTTRQDFLKRWTTPLGESWMRRFV